MNNQLIRGNLFLFSKPEPESKQFEKGERFFLNQAGTTESLFIVLRVTKENQLILARAFPTQQKNTCKVIIGRKEYWVRFSNLLFAERKWLSDITIYQGRCSYGNISKIYSCYNNWKEQIKKQAREKAIRKREEKIALRKARKERLERERLALYKDGAFRSKYKGYEFSDLNKRFTLKQLIDDIETITFEDFVRITNTIVTPGNVCVYVSGDCSELDFSMLSLQSYAEQSVLVRIAGYDFDPYLRQDAHITNKAREDHNLIIEALDFLNGDCTNFTKLLITELLAEQVPVHEIDVWVDSLDASIMFSSEQLREYKSYLNIDTEKAYNIAHKNLLTKYASLLENSPEQFAIKASHMMSVGVYIDQYLEFLDKCSYELFVELCEKANYKITEAQIVLRKESR